jgi:hypothetical protein
MSFDPMPLNVALVCGAIVVAFVLLGGVLAWAERRTRPAAARRG